MNAKEFREFLSDIPDEADVSIVLDDYRFKYAVGWLSEYDNGSKTSASEVYLFLGANDKERAGS